MKEWVPLWVQFILAINAIRKMKFHLVLEPSDSMPINRDMKYIWMPMKSIPHLNLGRLSILILNQVSDVSNPFKNLLVLLQISHSLQIAPLDLSMSAHSLMVRSITMPLNHQEMPLSIIPNQPLDAMPVNQDSNPLDKITLWMELNNNWDL